MDSVVIADCDLPGDVLARELRRAGHRIHRAASAEAQDIAAAEPDAAALVVQWASITPAIMDAMPNLKVISRMGIGYDMVDVEAATARGIAVTNTPGYCVEEVASHTLAMIMTLTRALPSYHAAVRAGRWAPTVAQPTPKRPSMATVVVVGYGRIGALVARHCAAIGFRVLVCDPYADPGRVASDGMELRGLTEALVEADVVTLHAPLTEQTRHLIGAETLAAMPEGAVVINTCRGPLIDECALVESLRSGHTAAAGLDVFADEPLPGESPLRSLENVVLSPHAAWYSREALADLPTEAASNVSNFLAGKAPASVVNPGYRDVVA